MSQVVIFACLALEDCENKLLPRRMSVRQRGKQSTKVIECKSRLPKNTWRLNTFPKTFQNGFGQRLIKTDPFNHIAQTSAPAGNGLDQRMNVITDSFSE
ncbi:MAG: hypothetical protein V4563_14130 [Pseudomonadota bacterium]